MKSPIAYVLLLALGGCLTTPEKSADKTLVIFDTDTNNELDDQHALAYLLFNGGTFDVAGITVNATRSGGDIDSQYAEAERVMRLCGYHSKLSLFKGANGNFDSIQFDIDKPHFDGHEAVNFIIGAAKESTDRELTVIAVGKLTNVALALKKSPAIAERLRIVWLGGNYPASGEYNLENDTASVNYVLKTNVPFEMATVRYGESSGTAAVTVTQSEINDRMPGKGPEVIIPVTGRHGDEFRTFGDYSVNLFEHIHYDGDPPSRALFDMAAVAIVKNPRWAKPREIGAPLYINNGWVDNPRNDRRITVWENFNRKEIIDDFYYTIDNYVLVDFD